MLIGYVSDEDYAALADVLVEFDQDGHSVATTRSTARGAILADLPPGDYRVTLQKPGFGSKRVQLSTLVSRLSTPHQFRLLSDRLAGYVWPKWARAGERGEFRVHAVEPYHLSLHRYGLRTELVHPLGWYDAHGPRTMMQITPDGDYTQTGVGWNRVGWGSPHHTQFVVAPERSGLYYFHAHTESGAFFSFPWVVAPAQPQAPVAVLASTLTWNAYNRFGGRSNYVNSRGLPPEPTVNARQDLQRYQGGAYDEWLFPDTDYAPLSFERPEHGNHIPQHTQITDPIAGRDACHQAPAEWRLLGWLEREGFAYDFYAEQHHHDGQLDLDAYRVLILSAHPEYWTRQMMVRVREWVHERGGRLLYLGGNGLNCEVELLDGDRMRCLSQIPEAAGRGPWSVVSDQGSEVSETAEEQTQSKIENPKSKIESRFHRTFASEAALLGVGFTEAGIMTAAPYRVEDADHWVFEGTGLRNGDLFGEKSLHERIPGGASGHETDKRGPSSPPQTVLLARGTNPEEGGAEMVIYEVPGGGMVFSAGSITYPACLLVDDALSRVTRNVLTRFLEGGTLF